MPDPEYLHIKPLKEGPCEVHDWPIEGMPQRLVAAMRANHPKGINACRECVERATREGDRERRGPYKIVRMYQDPDLENRDIRRGLTLLEAQSHCKNPETNSQTCTTDEGKARTAQYGDWFDGFTEDAK